MRVDNATRSVVTEEFLRFCPSPDRLIVPPGYRDSGFALVDAVFSMQARYEGARPVVANYARSVDVDMDTPGLPKDASTPDQHGVDDLRRHLEHMTPSEAAERNLPQPCEERPRQPPQGRPRHGGRRKPDRCGGTRARRHGSTAHRRQVHRTEEGLDVSSRTRTGDVRVTRCPTKLRGQAVWVHADVDDIAIVHVGVDGPVEVARRARDAAARPVPFGDGTL